LKAEKTIVVIKTSKFMSRLLNLQPSTFNLQHLIFHFQLLICLFALFLSPPMVFAEDVIEDDFPDALLVSVQGKLIIKRDKVLISNWELPFPLLERDRLDLLEGTAEVLYPDETRVRLLEPGEFVISESFEAQEEMGFLSSLGHFLIQLGEKIIRQEDTYQFVVSVSSGVIAVRGTRFEVHVKEDHTWVDVKEGSVLYSSPFSGRQHQVEKENKMWVSEEEVRPFDSPRGPPRPLGKMADRTARGLRILKTEIKELRKERTLFSRLLNQVRERPSPLLKKRIRIKRHKMRSRLRRIHRLQAVMGLHWKALPINLRKKYANDHAFQVGEYYRLRLHLSTFFPSRSYLTYRKAYSSYFKKTPELRKRIISQHKMAREKRMKALRQRGHVDRFFIRHPHLRKRMRGAESKLSREGKKEKADKDKLRRPKAKADVLKSRQKPPRKKLKEERQKKPSPRPFKKRRSRR